MDERDLGMYGPRRECLGSDMLGPFALRGAAAEALMPILVRRERNPGPRLTRLSISETHSDPTLGPPRERLPFIRGGVSTGAWHTASRVPLQVRPSTALAPSPIYDALIRGVSHWGDIGTRGTAVGLLGWVGMLHVHVRG